MFKFVIVFLFLTFTCVYSQGSGVSREDQAYQLALDAINKANEGKYNEAITIFKDAISLDPRQIAYPYEIALTYYRMKEFSKAADILDSLLIHPQVNDQVYQLLGNSYDFLGQQEKAKETYLKGLEFFPESGRLYMELGIVEGAQKNIRMAVAYWEKGILADPSYPDNYYRLASYYALTSERVWAVIYGEIFMNISPNQGKITEISKLLYKTYNDALFYRIQDSTAIKFTNINIKTTYNLDTNQVPFQFAFNEIMKDAAEQFLPKDTNYASINDLINIRKNFVEKWFSEKSISFKFENILFNRQKELIDEDKFEAYNYWLFKAANEDKFSKWIERNKDDFIEFGKWFEKNPMKINKYNFISIDRY